MATSPLRVEISDNPELLRIVERAEAAGLPVVLERGGRRVAEVWPLEPKVNIVSAAEARDWRPTAEQLEAFRSAAGSMPDLDIEEFRRQLREGRELDERPVVEL